MTHVYVCPTGFSVTPRLFSSFRKAEEFTLQQIRGLKSSCGFRFSFESVYVDSQQSYKYKYSGSCIIAGNKKLLTISHPNGTIINEVVITFYPKTDYELVERQLEDYAPSCPKTIYFNDKNSISNYLKEFIDEINEEDPLVEHFKYKLYMYNRI